MKKRTLCQWGCAVLGGLIGAGIGIIGGPLGIAVGALVGFAAGTFVGVYWICD